MCSRLRAFRCPTPCTIQALVNSGRTDGRMRSHSGEQPTRNEGVTMGRAHRLVSAVSKERLAGMVPLRRVPAMSLILLRRERFRQSTKQSGGLGPRTLERCGPGTTGFRTSRAPFPRPEHWGQCQNTLRQRGSRRSTSIANLQRARRRSLPRANCGVLRDNCAIEGATINTGVCTSA
jgi:hypothetical protein